MPGEFGTRDAENCMPQATTALFPVADHTPSSNRQRVNSMDVGLLIARLILGLAMSAHGAQKLFGWFGGHGLSGTGGFFESIGFRPGRLFALAAGLAEFGGGALTALGLLGPVGPALIISVMMVALLTVHLGHGFFAQSNGIELPVMYITGALALASAGPGVYSLDYVLGLGARPSPGITWSAVIVAVALALLSMALRRHAHAERHA
ncbi:MAG TPA: DoxX family protein [Candidatus Acidoferrum sp.]|nr:DoxX family protein [Candidatus Acidoferrum sp.]